MVSCRNLLYDIVLTVSVHLKPGNIFYVNYANIHMHTDTQKSRNTCKRRQSKRRYDGYTVYLDYVEYHRFTYRSELVKMCTLNMWFFVYQLHFNKALQK